MGCGIVSAAPDPEKEYEVDVSQVRVELVTSVCEVVMTLLQQSKASPNEAFSIGLSILLTALHRVTLARPSTGANDADVFQIAVRHLEELDRVSRALQKPTCMADLQRKLQGLQRDSAMKRALAHARSQVRSLN